MESWQCWLSMLSCLKASFDLCLGQALRAWVTGPSCADAAMSLAVLSWWWSSEKAAEEEQSHFSYLWFRGSLCLELRWSRLSRWWRVVLEEAAHLRMTRKQEGRRGLARDKTHPWKAPRDPFPPNKPHPLTAYSADTKTQFMQFSAWWPSHFCVPLLCPIFCPQMNPQS